MSRTSSPLVEKPGPSATVEIELKLEIEGVNASLVKAHPLLASAECHAAHQITVYYDTPKGSLRQKGYSLRVRKANDRFVQTVKPISAGAGLFARLETESEVSSMEPDIGILNTVISKSIGKRDTLSPIVRSVVQRTSWRLTRGDSAVEVDLDEGTITAGKKSQSFVELEFELLSGDPRDLLFAAAELTEQIPARIGVLSKAERGFALADGLFERVNKAAPVEVRPGMSVAEAFAIIVAACLKHYRLNEGLVTQQRNAEALHQARVAMRRLRSAFYLFKSTIADQDFLRLRAELRWFTSELGEARNLDVYLERELPAKERRAVATRREQAYDRVVEAMNSQRLRRLFMDLVAWVALGAWRSGRRSSKPITPFASKRLTRLWLRIERAGRTIADLDEHTRHELRIQIKKMRYAVEFLSGLFLHAAKKQKHFVKVVARLQEALGKMNDLATARSIVAAVPADDWLITPSEEAVHLRQVERHLNELIKVGPYWHSAARKKGRVAR